MSAAMFNRGVQGVEKAHKGVQEGVEGVRLPVILQVESRLERRALVYSSASHAPCASDSPGMLSQCTAGPETCVCTGFQVLPCCCKW